MLERIPDLPDNVVGVRATGWVEARDYTEVLVPAAEAAIARHGKVRLLYQTGPGFVGFTPGAMWDDMKLGLSHLHAWERVAVVTDVVWIAGATRFMLFAMPCPVKVFGAAQLGEAEAWLVGDQP